LRITNTLKRPEKWVVVLLMLVFSVNFLGFTVAPKHVKIQVDGQTIALSTRALTVKGALEEAGVVLQKADGYDVVGNGDYEDGATIEVVRAMPIKVWQSGRTTEYTIGRKTVKDVLNAVGVSYSGYKVYPSLDTPAEAGMTIYIVSPTAEVKTENATVPYKVEMRNNDNLPRGRQRVISPGKDGEAVVTYRMIQIGSQKVKREVARKVVSQPVPQVVEVGTGKNLMVETSRGFVRYRSARTLEASAYTLAEGSGTGLTSTGVVPYHGVVAVDPDVIPYGTRMFIPGYGFAVAADCGGAINGDRIDLFMDSYSEAISWGRRDVTVYFLE
jgi:3D (Asp-Asp-Asp) domain-containing protein